MLDAFKRWISGAPPSPEWRDIVAWCESRRYGFKREREGEGFVVDGRLAEQTWRLEWGPPQRPYIATRELRIRMELGMPSQLQMLLLSRPLMEALEAETFDRYTESNQTQIDLSTPEEMRWMAMFPKATLAIERELRMKFGAVANDPAFAIRWVDEPFAAALQTASEGLLKDAPPFLIMSLRGRLYLRLQLSEMSTTAIDQALKLFEAAVRSALRLAGSAGPEGSDWSSSAAEGATAWQSQYPPDPPKP